MEFVLTLILALMIAILYNWGKPKFDATGFGTKLGKNFYGATVATAIVLLVAIYVAALLGGFVGVRSGKIAA